MNKAVFLDRDGTINVEKNYLYKIEDFEFLPGVIDGLKLLQEAGFLLIIITNQSGIARGYYNEEDFDRLNHWMLEQLKNAGVIISRVYYCPHLPDAPVEMYRKDCDCRKPKLGMFDQAIRDYNIDISLSYAIGDKLRDCAVCENTSCKGFLVGNSEKEDIIQDVIKNKYNNITHVNTFYDCVQEIMKRKCNS